MLTFDAARAMRCVRSFIYLNADGLLSFFSIVFLHRKKPREKLIIKKIFDFSLWSTKMADAFTDEQIQEFYEAFCLIDKDSDGQSDFIIFCPIWHIVCFIRIDLRIVDDGLVDLYMVACNTGFITKEKLTKVMKSMGKSPNEEQLQEMMSHVDIFGNGGITFDDFLYIMAQNTSQV